MTSNNEEMPFGESTSQESQQQQQQQDSNLISNGSDGRQPLLSANNHSSGSNVWSSLGSQSPASEGGGFYRRFRGRGYVPPPRNQDWYHAAFVLVAELVGTGVLALPHTFGVVGLVSGLSLLLVFSVLSLYSGILLYRLQSWFPQGITYGDMAFEVIGKGGQTIVFGFIYVAFFGNLAIYILTCAETLQNVFYDQPNWCKWWFTVVTCIFLFPFCQLRTLHHVSYVAALSAIAIFMALFIVLALTFTDPSDVPATGGNDDGPSFVKTMSAITTAIFAFGGQGLYFETMAEMKRPGDFPKAVSSTTGLIFVIYVVVATSCNVIYGDNVKGNILFALPNGHGKRIAALLLFFHVCISYVLAQQVIGRAIHVRTYPHDVDSGTKREKVQWMMISVLLLCISFLIANGIPIFHHLMGFVAALSTAPLTFGIPALMVLKSKSVQTSNHPLRGIVEWYEYPVLYFFMILSVFLIVVGFISNTIELSNTWDHMGKPFACHTV